MNAPDSLDIMGSPGKIEESGSPAMRDFRYAPTRLAGSTLRFDKSPTRQSRYGDGALQGIFDCFDGRFCLLFF
jgi:hypothetical protein